LTTVYALKKIAQESV